VSFFFCVSLCVANDFFRPWPAFIGCLSRNKQFQNKETVDSFLSIHFLATQGLGASAEQPIWEQLHNIGIA